MLRQGGGVSAGEVQTMAAARALRGKRSVFIGVGRPSTAAILARMVHNPELVLFYESGTIGAKPYRVPLSIGDGELAETADAVVSVPEMFNYWIGPGRVQVAFLGAAQVDRHGDLNSTVIGDYEHPKTRLPGAGGAPEIALGCPEVVVIAPHSRRTFVEELDFRTTSGVHTTAVITDLGVLEPRDGELTLTAVHPGVTVEQVREETGWELRVAERGGHDGAADGGGAGRAAGAARRVAEAYMLRRGAHPVRPLRRRAGGGAPRRPRRPRRARARRALARARPGAHRRGDLRRRQPGGRGQPQRRAHGDAPGRPAHERSRHDRQPAVRILPRRRDAGEPHDRDGRRLARPRGRGGVDVARARRPAQAREGVRDRRPDAALDHARLAHGQPGDARAVDDLARREHGEAGRDPRHRRARPRTRSPCAATA